MARIDLAAGFIKANMPLAQGNALSDQDAWDVAAFIDRHERPKDPRQMGTCRPARSAEYCRARQLLREGPSTLEPLAPQLHADD